ncbi:MAG: adenylate/guanylate cyclase domain-containing protein [Microcoleaceae cyanobacterium]
MRISTLRQWIKKWPDLKGRQVVVLATTLCSILLLSITQLGLLQPLELNIYDQMIRWRPDLGADSRLLIVEITEEDIRAFNRWPLSDEIIARLIEKLSQYEPSVIGLDIYRDIRYEPGYQRLRQQFENNDNIVAIQTLGNGETTQIAAPPGVPAERIGFNDSLISDPDGVVRRNLLFAETEAGNFYSFSLQLALKYLADQEIYPENSPTDPDVILWGKAALSPLQKTDGGYQTVEDLGYQQLLDYRSARNVARTVSITQVLYGRIESSWIKDKIVLIGTTAPSAKDIFLTPYSPAEKNHPKMPGVSIHAHMVSQILDAVNGTRQLFQFWPEWIEILWLIGWIFLGATLGMWSRNPIVLGFGTPLLLSLLVTFSYLCFLRSQWIPVICPSLGILFAPGLVIAYRAFRAQQQQQMMMRLLGQNASPEVAKALWENRDRLLSDGILPGQRIIATMLFTDIKNFSTVSEQMSPEKLMEWLNEYLGALTQSVQGHHGIINKFTGDGIMAAFGVPVTQQTDKEIAINAEAAVSCGLEFSQQLKRLNKDWKKRGLPAIQMRVGIFTGPIVAGSLGGKDRLEYGLLGDSVNIASRLESCYKDRQISICRVLIAQQTLEYIEGLFEVESWGPLPLKGKRQLVNVYRVMGKKSAINT